MLQKDHFLSLVAVVVAVVVVVAVAFIVVIVVVFATVRNSLQTQYESIFSHHLMILTRVSEVCDDLALREKKCYLKTQNINTNLYLLSISLETLLFHSFRTTV